MLGCCKRATASASVRKRAQLARRRRGRRRGSSSARRVRFERSVPGLVDDAHAAPAQLAQDLVAGDGGFRRLLSRCLRQGNLATGTFEETGGNVSASSGSCPGVRPMELIELQRAAASVPRTRPLPGPWAATCVPQRALTRPCGHANACRLRSGLSPSREPGSACRTQDTCRSCRPARP